eukprot:gnl/TRDRNA2_/TRDRNA2_168516_c0_seq3.p1 gnl/TRDRNA2_/TRDRNA2_168516_c0~~gnl/TRDRNA2_/TRDRNA2_168516_c0_seq3.p1  ORF type:complete len:335 (+),score=59.39 gnl/TRDRNA2_/TRDRNA2_168516_c0_seq3:70-1074(+)
MWHIYGLLLLASFALLRADDCGDNAIEKCDSFALYQTFSVLLTAKDRTKQLQPAGTLMASSEKAAAQETLQEQPAAKPVALAQTLVSGTWMHRHKKQHNPSGSVILPSKGDVGQSHTAFLTGKPVVDFLYEWSTLMEMKHNQGRPSSHPTFLLVASLGVWSCLVLLAAKFALPKFKREEGVPLANDENRVKKTNEQMQQWSSGTFDCCQSRPLCAASLCCPLVVFADTMASVHVVNFWLILLCLVALAWLDLLILPLFVWMLTCLVMVFYRHKLRAKFDMAHYTFSTIAGDFLGYCMCFPCFISQEARHVEEAVFSGHSAVKALEEKEPAEDAA